jgi:hypothetical protein
MAAAVADNSVVGFIVIYFADGLILNYSRIVVEDHPLASTGKGLCLIWLAPAFPWDFLLARIKVKATKVEKDVRLEPLDVPINIALLSASPP